VQDYGTGTYSQDYACLLLTRRGLKTPTKRAKIRLRMTAGANGRLLLRYCNSTRAIAVSDIAILVGMLKFEGER
jgi:hypothetical protein